MFREEIHLKKQLIITVSREFGSGGHEIAVILSQRFGLPVYEQNLLKKLAEKYSLDADRLLRYDESPRNIFTSRRVNGFSNAPEENIARMQFEYLQDQAEKGESFVVVGRCAEEVLKGYPGLVTVFVWADIGFKKQRVMARDNTSEADALELMEKTDRKRKYYHNQFCQGKWGRAQNYDITINSGRLGISGTADLLERYIRQRTESK